jgi:hypothetical protein
MLFGVIVMSPHASWPPIVSPAPLRTCVGFRVHHSGAACMAPSLLEQGSYHHQSLNRVQMPYSACQIGQPVSYCVLGARCPACLDFWWHHVLCFPPTQDLYVLRRGVIPWARILSSVIEQGPIALFCVPNGQAVSVGFRICTSCGAAWASMRRSSGASRRRRQTTSACCPRLRRACECQTDPRHHVLLLHCSGQAFATEHHSCSCFFRKKRLLFKEKIFFFL